MKTEHEMYFSVRNELKELKQLVNEFLDAIYYVPFRAVDCDQDTVEDLWEKLADAVDSDRSRYEN
jgi:hypothetical protein